MTEEEMQKQVISYCEKNPMKVYGDQRDSLPKNLISYILKGEYDKFHESWCEIEFTYHDNMDWSDYEKELAKHLEKDSFDDLQESIKETYRDHRIINCDDLLKTCLRNSSPHVVAIPLKKDGELIVFPHGELYENENDELIKYLKDTLGIENPWEAETIYSFDALKVCGTVNLEYMLENRVTIKGVWIGPEQKSQLVTHNNLNGSGGMGSINPTKKVLFPCRLKYDEEDRYGVDEVFGFTSAFWSQELPLEFNIPDPKPAT